MESLREVPALWWFDRFDERLGLLRPAGPLVHTEEVGGEDALDFDCLEAPSKGDRLVWADGGVWREHVVVRTDEGLDGVCRVHAESSLCDLLGDYIEDLRLVGATASAALAAVLAPTRWSAGDVDPAMTETHGAWLYHRSCLAGLRRVEELWGCEAEAAIAVSDKRVVGRSVRLRARLGSDRGMRLEWGRNMAGCTRTVLEDEVYTALWGWGAGLPVTDEDGRFTGGYRRKLGIASVNGGIGWVGNEDARLAWGLWNAERSEKVHRFGEVTFPGVDDPQELLGLTQAALADACVPKVSYEVDAAILGPGDVGLGDDVAVIDSSGRPGWRVKARAVRRVRTFGPGAGVRLTVGRVERGAWEAAAETEARLAAVEEVAGAVGDALGAAASRDWVEQVVEEAAAGAGEEGAGAGELKARALLLADGTLEFTYRDSEAGSLGAAVEQVWDVDPAGYASPSGRPWDAAKSSVTSAVFDAEFSGAGVASFDYWFHGCTNLVEVSGFEALSGMESAVQMFASCAALETIYATSFDNSALAAAGSMFYGCPRLVGGDGTVPTSSSAAGACALGAGGVLTDPADDGREWLRCLLYDDGELVITASGRPEAGRGVLSDGRLCATARYTAVGAVPWYAHRADVESATVAADAAGLSGANLNYWFYGHQALGSVAGLGNLPAVRQMRYAFTSCTALVSLDLRGVDPSLLEDAAFAFGGCSALATILADAAWTLPAAASGGLGTFQSCTSLVGGAGSVYDAARTGAAYMRIDGGAGAEGYLTAG